MKIAAHVIAYDVNRFINPMLRNVAPWVDKIYVAHAPRPWAYIPSSRLTRTNPTKVSDIKTEGLPCPIEIVPGDWEWEEQARNECLRRAKAEGFDWFITQDADELYTEDSWRQLRHALRNDRQTDCFWTTWYHFWKSSDYIAVYRNGSFKTNNVGFALRCKDGLEFAGRRMTNTSNYRILDCPCYHYGYALTDEEMQAKVTQWSHARELNAHRWFQRKWLRWRFETENLDPTTPRNWRRAIRFPLHQPDFAAEFALRVVEPKLTLGDRAADLIYDGRTLGYDLLRDTKRAIIGQG